METSIAVKGSTLQLLIMLKEKMKAKSIDETIVRTIQKVENAPRSQFGSNPKLKSFSRKDRAEFHEL